MLRKGYVATLNFDWFELGGWVCPFCGGEIDHFWADADEDEGYTDDSYKCQDLKGMLCEHAYVMVRWSNTKRGENGDALTLKRWVDLEIPNVYIDAAEEITDEISKQ